MSNVWMLMRLRFTNNYRSALRNVKTTQNSHARIFLKGYNDNASQNSDAKKKHQLEDPNDSKSKKEPNPDSSKEEIPLDSTDSNKTVKGPKKPSPYKGGGPIHNKKYDEEKK